MNIWFTSDHHYSHARVIGYTQRPFKTIDEMNEGLIAAWNSVVKGGDTVYHCGDLAFLKPNEVAALVKKLNGQIHLVRGNHDRFLKNKNHDSSFGFAWVGDYKEVKVGAQKIILCHYPFLTWNGRHHGTWSLHGHCHNSLAVDLTTKRMDVGVDAVAALLAGDSPRTPSQYRPFSYEEVELQMAKRGIAPIDHHERRGGDDESPEGDTSAWRIANRTINGTPDKRVCNCGGENTALGHVRGCPAY